MVVTVAKATSAEYYVGLGGVAAGQESYYLDAVTEGEPPGQWSGSGADRLGLSGEVDAEDMTAVFGEFVNPVTGEAIGSGRRAYRSVQDRLDAALTAEPAALPERVEELRRQIEGSAQTNTIGWDATFSVPKSVTVAHTAAHRAEVAAIRSGDVERAEQFAAIRTGIESAILEANAAMLDYAETIAVVRTGRHGGHSETARWEAAPGLVVASFFQHTNRNIDPQLHVHNPILNRAYSADGKARALDGQDLLAQQHALGAVADRVLEERLTGMGFQVELRPDGMARELTVVPTAIVELFSSRDQQVSAKVAELLPAAEEKAGRELTELEIYRLKKAATLSTRTAKSAHAHETREELLSRWWASTVASGSNLDQVGDDMVEHLQHRRAAEEAGTATAAAEWSATAIISEAVAACGQRKSAWRSSDLMLEIARRLPSLGGLDAKSTQQVLTGLVEQALAGDLVRQVAGRNIDDLAELLDSDPATASSAAAALAADPSTPPSARLYATTDTLLAEEALRRASIERGAHHLNAAAVNAWLDEHATTIGADQRAAVAGIAATDARLAVLVGPAGTGKSYAAGTFAHAWADLTTADGQPGRVVGLAVSQIATQVLRDDGIEDARNITQWLDVQDKLTAGSTHPADTAWTLRPTDVVMVDEASMVATADLHRIHTLTQHAGARLVLTGDPRQLGAVEAGGVMGLLDGHAETYTLADVRRFATDWEPAASLALRDGDPDALTEYDRHGRLLSHDTPDDAVTAAARAAVADRLDGRSVVVVTATNEQAAQVATTVRDQLIDLGLVEPDGVLLGLDGGTAGVGDLIAARRNNYALGVINRAQYKVTAVGEDGSLTVVPADHNQTDPTSAAPARELVLPASYVGEHVQLGYASTVHAAQGMTVDSAHLLTDGTMDAATLYVAMTRGRLTNTAHVSLNTPTTADTRPAATTAAGGQVRLEDATTRASARAVLEASLQRGQSNRAATVEAELDAARLSNMSVLAGRLEAVVRIACRERLDRHLDELTARGVLDPHARARLGADQGSEHLSRLLRAVEQTGQDPRQVLTDAITARSLSDADSVAQVLSHRITGGQPLPHPLLPEAQAAGNVSEREQGDVAGLVVPGDIAPALVEHVEHLQARVARRQDELGQQIAADPPAWALQAFGPVPTHAVDSTDSGDSSRGGGVAWDDSAWRAWVQRAGTVAAHREATGWAHEQQAISTMPGLAATEQRASYTAAWEALGRPEAALDETGMSEGRLRARVRAGQLERAWAPPHADAALRAAETERETARQGAAIARAHAEQAERAGDSDAVARHAADAAVHEGIVTVKDAAIPALQVAVQARSAWASSATVAFEVEQRGKVELERRGIRIGAEPDRIDTVAWLAADRAAREADDAHRPITELDLHDTTADEAAALIEQVPADELAHLPEATTGPDPWNHTSDADTADDAATPTGRAPNVDDTAIGNDRGEYGWGHSPAHAVLPADASAEQVEAGAALAALALRTVADRASQDAAHVEDADLDDTHHSSSDNSRAESDEQGRRRRDAADQQQAMTTRSAAREASADVADV